MNEPVYEKLLRWCMYRDRCISEVRLKCKELGLDDHQTEKMILRLMEENWVDELRFAKQYVQSKCTLKKWGKQKIRFELKRKRVNSDIIEQALGEIEDEDYKQILYKIAEKKWNSLKEPNPGKKKLKLQAYLRQKGYTGEDIQEVIKQLDKK